MSERPIRVGDVVVSEDGATAKIPLRARNGAVVGYALVDVADAEFANQWRWCLNGKESGYVRRRGVAGGRQIKVYLHREILGLVFGDGLDGDHINRDKLDNRRSNLRVIPSGKQAQNPPPRTGGSSRFRGVTWYKARRKWMAQVQINGKHVCFGYFADELEAAEAARNGRARLLPYAVD